MTSISSCTSGPSRHPELVSIRLLPLGASAAFVGRFPGPLRAIVPIAPEVRHALDFRSQRHVRCRLGGWDPGPGIFVPLVERG
jgi:hypothetical protein